MSIQSALVRDFDLELPNTVKLLQALPEERLDWKPHDRSMSLGQLAGHLAETPSWVGAMLEDEMDFLSMPSDYEPYVAASRADAIATLEANATAFRDAMRDRADAFLEATWTMRKGDDVLMACPRHEAIRSTIVHHTLHHRGQLTVCLRLLDVPVPATFGSTADFPMF